MAPVHLLTAVKAGVATSTLVAAANVAHVIATAADTGGAIDLPGVLTGGAGVTSAAVLCLVAIKFARGELVARDVLKSEAALTKLAEDRGTEIAGLRADREIDRELTRELIEAITTNRRPPA